MNADQFAATVEFETTWAGLGTLVSDQSDAQKEALRAYCAEHGMSLADMVETITSQPGGALDQVCEQLGLKNLAVLPIELIEQVAEVRKFAESGADPIAVAQQQLRLITELCALDKEA